MKTIGLLGGMSWESTETYYRLINEGIKSRLGGLHSAKICLYSVDFEELEIHLQTGNWSEIASILSAAAKKVENAGADFLVVCTNTMHNVVPEIESKLQIPVLHIADATAETIKTQGIATLGLLGTRFTMEQDFYKGRLAAKHGLKVIIPNESERQVVHRIIFEELVLGKLKPESRAEYVRIIDRLAAQGAEAVVLGCTEIAMLVKQAHTPVRLFDTTRIHAEEAVARALSKVQTQ